jgi:hypothetical protein
LTSFSAFAACAASAAFLALATASALAAAAFASATLFFFFEFRQQRNNIARTTIPPTVQPIITPVLALFVRPPCSDAAAGRLVEVDVEVECEVVVAGLLAAVFCADVELFGFWVESVRIEVDTV